MSKFKSFTEFYSVNETIKVFSAEQIKLAFEEMTNGKLSYNFVDGGKGTTMYTHDEFDDEDGSFVEEFTVNFEKVSVSVKYEWSYKFFKSKYAGTHDTPPDPNEIKLDNIIIKEVDFLDDKEMTIELTSDMKLAITSFIENQLPVDGFTNSYLTYKKALKTAV